MNDLRDDPCWNKAAFLHERAALPGQTAGALDGTRLRQAHERVAQWRAHMMGVPEALEERLAAVGLDADEFARLLQGHMPETSLWQGTRSWLDTVAAIVEQGGGPLPEPFRPSPAGDAEPQAEISFRSFLAPFLTIGLQTLRAETAALQARHQLPELLSPQAETDLLDNLARRLQMQSMRTLILELNVARMLDRLPGTTSHERYIYFSEAYFQNVDRIVELLKEYPVLARLMGTTIDRWVATTLEMLERLIADREQVAGLLGCTPDPFPLVTVEANLSDRHRQGRAVLCLTLASGAQLIYKPKALGIDARFQELLGWLSQQGLSLDHRPLPVLNRGSHGWVAFVHTAECENIRQVEAFYWRQGSLLALFYLLKAVDVHLENLIAAGASPVPVDLEGLFHHQPVIDYGTSAFGRAMALLDRSVLVVGMLPVFLLGKNGQSGIDLSSLGGDAGQTYPYSVAKIDRHQLDTMRVVRGPATSAGSQNRPRLGGQVMDAARFSDQIVAGFCETYACLQQHRPTLRAWIRSCADLEVRHIVRPTVRYAWLLQESHHPDFLRDGLDRDRLFDKLWAEVKVRPGLRPVVALEHADMLLEDVPLLTARPGWPHLYGSAGAVLEHYFAKDSMSEVLERLDGLSEADCAAEVALIQGALIAIDHEPADTPRTAAAGPAAPPDAGLLQAAAVAIGEHLQRKAIRGADDACWIGVSLSDLGRWRWSLAPVGTSLYEGVGGIALFLAYLAAATGRPDFAELARAAAQPLVRQARWPERPEELGVGAFLGRAGFVYVLSHLARLWDEPALLELALAAVSDIGSLIDQDQNLDLLSGAAGCLAVLLGVYRQTGLPEVLKVACRCGDHLLQTAVPCGGGLGWRTTAAPQPIAGLSHGSAGIAWPLLALSGASGEPRYHETALATLRFERTLFAAEQGNWRDLRQTGGPGQEQGSFMTAWCNGAPGIVLGRLLGLRDQDDPETRAEIAQGLACTLREGFGGSHCLCHGDVGQIEILDTASAALGEPVWGSSANRVAREVAQAALSAQWRCGLPKYRETPGLMLGLAGIGLGLLRRSAPLCVPSVVQLQAAHTLRPFAPQGLGTSAPREVWSGSVPLKEETSSSSGPAAP